MRIPVGFYLIYWLRNSALALATGFLVVLLIPPLFAIAPWTGLIIFAIYQIYMYEYFIGNRRGDFEFAYREVVIEKLIREAIIKKYGWFVFLRYVSDKLSQIRTFKEDYILNLSQEKTGCVNENLEFAIYLKLAEFSIRNGNYEKGRIYLEKAIEKKPMNLLAHFRLAVSLEESGAGDGAIEHYKSALQDPDDLSDQLKEFIKRQISLVATYGPRKKPPIPGLRFITW